MGVVDEERARSPDEPSKERCRDASVGVANHEAPHEVGDEHQGHEIERDLKRRSSDERVINSLPQLSRSRVEPPTPYLEPYSAATKVISSLIQSVS